MKIVEIGGFCLWHGFCLILRGNNCRRENPAVAKERNGNEKKALTPFQAISVAIGGTVGVSNMSGVATAIATGGPGALFWLWVAALMGMIIKMAEVTLAVYYREKQPDGTFRGGPTYYMQNGLGKEKGYKFWKIFAVIFGLCIFMTWFITLQNYTVSEAIGGTFDIPYIVPSIILAVNWDNIPNTFAMIFKGAFTAQSATGGFLGASVAYTMRLGFARSVYSNEAGWGTSPMVHASANTDHPVKQGLMGAFEVFVDTIIICTLTGLVVIATGYWNSGLEGATLTLTAFESVMGSAARIMVALSIFLFGLTTSTGWFTYYQVILDHWLGGNKKVNNIASKIFIIGTPLWGFLVTLLTVYGNGTPSQLWVIADFTTVFPTFFNIITLFLLSGTFITLLKDYRARYLKEGTLNENTALFYEDAIKKIR